MFGPGAEWTARIRSPHGTGKGRFGKLPRSAVLMRKKIQEVSCLISSRKGSSYLKDCFCSCKFESPTTNKANKFAHRFFFMSNDKLLLSFYQIPTSWNHLPQKKRHLRIQLFGLLAIFLECDFPPQRWREICRDLHFKGRKWGKKYCKVYGRTAAQKTTLFGDAMAGMAWNHKILPALIEIQGSQIKCIALAYKRWKKVFFFGIQTLGSCYM